MGIMENTVIHLMKSELVLWVMLSMLPITIT